MNEPGSKPPMSTVFAFVLSFSALLTCAASALVGVAMAEPPKGDGPLVVVAAPWSGGVDHVVASAGASPVGPKPAPLSLLAAGAEAQAYLAAGALMVLDPGALPFLCNR